MNVVFALPLPKPVRPAAGEGAGGAEPPASAGGVALHGISQVAAELFGVVAGQGWHAEIGYLGSKKKISNPDLIVNCICDASLHGDALDLLAAIVSAARVPVINHPWAVLRNTRHETSRLLAHQAGVRVPPTSLFAPDGGTLAEHVELSGHAFPVLVRPLGAHGGRGLVKIDGAADDLARRPAEGPSVVSDFVDTASPDGLYRKYRVAYVDDRLFRRHLIVADAWKVGGEARRFMVGRPDLIAEEKAFIAGRGGPDEDRLRHQFRALGLDFGAVDFALGADGTLTIFEINACFQLTRSFPEDKRERWGYLEDTNAGVTAALLALMERRARRKG